MTNGFIPNMELEDDEIEMDVDIDQFFDLDKYFSPSHQSGQDAADRKCEDIPLSPALGVNCNLRKRVDSHIGEEVADTYASCDQDEADITTVSSDTSSVTYVSYVSVPRAVRRASGKHFAAKRKPIKGSFSAKPNTTLGKLGPMKRKLDKLDGKTAVDSVKRVKFLQPYHMLKQLEEPDASIQAAYKKQSVLQWLEGVKPAAIRRS